MPSCPEQQEAGCPCASAPGLVPSQHLSPQCGRAETVRLGSTARLLPSLSALSSLPSRPFPLWHIWKLQLIFDYGLVNIFCFKKTPKVNILPSLALCVPSLACQLLGGARYLSMGVCGPFLSLLATIYSISLENRRAHEIPAWSWRLKPLPGHNSWPLAPAFLLLGDTCPCTGVSCDMGSG